MSSPEGKNARPRAKGSLPAWVIQLTFIVIVVAVVVPFIIALWRWATGI